jgi:AcrR family transcriptional regulator
MRVVVCTFFESDMFRNNRSAKGFMARRSGIARRGRKRSPEIDRAILDATLAVLAEVGVERFTANEVIARTGVSSATLYRRWPTMQDLVAAAIQSIGPEPVDIDTGSLEGDLAEFVELIGSALSRREGLAGAGSLGLKPDPILSDLIQNLFIRPRQKALLRILQRARRRGELGPLAPTEDCWSYVMGPVHHRIFLRREPFTGAFLRSTVLFVAAGLRALCARGDGSERGGRHAHR